MQDSDMADKRSPWTTLTARPDITVKIRDLTHTGHQGGTAHTGNGWLILLCTSLDQCTRSAVLAHELAHIDRDGGAWRPQMPPTWAAVVARDEHAADKAATLSMIPIDLLRDWLHRHEEGVTPLDVALEWDVPTWMATIAIDEALS